MVTSKHRPLHQATWGKACQAYTLLSTAGFEVKQETMPPGAEELLHYHQTALQFFFILKGEAVFEVNNVILMVHEGEGIQIDAGTHHKIMNRHPVQLEFLVCSQPSTENDRFNLA